MAQSVITAGRKMEADFLPQPYVYISTLLHQCKYTDWNLWYSNQTSNNAKSWLYCCKRWQQQRTLSLSDVQTRLSGNISKDILVRGMFWCELKSVNFQVVSILFVFATEQFSHWHRVGHWVSLILHCVFLNWRCYNSFLLTHSYVILTSKDIFIPLVSDILGPLN